MLFSRGTQISFLEREQITLHTTVWCTNCHNHYQVKRNEGADIERSPGQQLKGEKQSLGL